MINPSIDKNVEKSAREMRGLIMRSKRKLLEFEALASIAEINHNRSEKFDSAKDLVNSIN